MRSTAQCRGARLRAFSTVCDRLSADRLGLSTTRRVFSSRFEGPVRSCNNSSKHNREVPPAPSSSRSNRLAGADRFRALPKSATATIPPKPSRPARHRYVSDSCLRSLIRQTGGITIPHQLHELRPRFTIIEALPYDRPNTTMRRFTLCPTCCANTRTRSTGGSMRSPTHVPSAGPADAVDDR